VIEIRKEQKEDYGQIRIVNNRAFGQPEEGRIVNKIRRSCREIVSLVAALDDKIVGHIFFSPAIIKIPNGNITGVIKGMGLAQMAVSPEFQNRGIGSMLVTEGLNKIKDTKYPFVIVLGYEKYYPRFGFQRALEFGLKSQWDGVPDDAFMAMILDESVMKDVSGIIKYRDEFNEAM